MTVHVRYTEPANPEAPDAPRKGIVKIGDTEWNTPLPPPESGEIREAYERFLADGGVPEEYVPPPPPPAPRVVAMWRARTIMKVTPHGDGTLFDAVQAYIAGMADRLQKAAAEEALERGTEFDRDGVFVPLIAAGVGIDEPTMDALMEQAHALPA